MLLQDKNLTNGPYYSGRGHTLLASFESKISSIQLTLGNIIVATSIGSRHPPEIKYCTFSESLTNRPRSLERVRTFQDTTSSVSSTLWCADANPYPSSVSDRLAVGTSEQVVQLTFRPDASTVLETAMQTKSDVLALSWLSANVVSAGLRNGSVLLWDSRSRGGTLRLRHPGSVCSLRRFKTEHLLLTAGTQNSLAMYDLRMPREFKSPKPDLAETKKVGKGKKSKCSQPVIRFTGYKNSFHYPAGLDYCEPMGLLAVTQAEGFAKFFSIHNGDCVGATILMAKGEHINKSYECKDTGNPAHSVNCLRFVEDGIGGQQLLCNRGPMIMNYSWNC